MPVRTVRVALIGFGNAARRLAELLIEKRRSIEEIYGARIVCSAISTLRHGSIVGEIELEHALERVRSGDNLSSLSSARSVKDSFAAIDESGADIVIETTTLNIENGRPALDHIERALNSGKHAVTANKGPIAFAAKDLIKLAAERRLHFKYESTVMDGAPVFNLFERTLPLVEVKSIYGIVNSTANYVLTEMERGTAFQVALAEAQAKGIAEADPSLDIDGWDAAVKAAALANSLMNADLKPHMVEREGIRNLDGERLAAERRKGNKVRLVVRVEKRSNCIYASARPETISTDDLLYSIDAFSNAIIFNTDLMGTIAMVERNPELTQTAYGLLSDLISIIEPREII